MDIKFLLNQTVDEFIPESLRELKKPEAPPPPRLSPEEQKEIHKRADESWYLFCISIGVGILILAYESGWFFLLGIGIVIFLASLKGYFKS